MRLGITIGLMAYTSTKRAQIDAIKIVQSSNTSGGEATK